MYILYCFESHYIYIENILYQSLVCVLTKEHSFLMKMWQWYVCSLLLYMDDTILCRMPDVAFKACQISQHKVCSDCVRGQTWIQWSVYIMFPGTWDGKHLFHDAMQFKYSLLFFFKYRIQQNSAKIVEKKNKCKINVGILHM